MESTGFFRRNGPYSAAELAAEVGAGLAGGAGAGKAISDIRPLSDAGPEHLSFLDNRKYINDLQNTTAGACLIREQFADKLPSHTLGLFTDHPYHALARALMLFYPEAGHPLVATPGDTPIHPDACIEDGVVIEPGVVVGANAQIGKGSQLCAGAVIGARVRIGRDCFIGPNANVTHALLGDRVILHAGVCIGQDGFGFAMGPAGHLKVPQIGRVIIQNDVEIGANSAVDRGALDDTVIGEGTKIDNLVQIGHNVRMGRHCVIAGQVGISGSTVLEDFVAMGGQSACVGHIRIGAGAQIAAASGLSHSVPRGERWGGIPARPVSQWSREVALLKSLGETLKGRALARLKQLLK